MQRRQNGRSKESHPFQRPDHDAAIHRRAYVSAANNETMLERRKGNEASEPEETCQGIETQNGVFVEVASTRLVLARLREGRVEEEVGECEEGPAGGED